MTETYPEVVVPFEYTYNFPINTVWAQLDDFGGWSKWYPALVNMSLEGGDENQIGAIRKFSSKASSFVYEEKLVEKDVHNYTLKYLVLAKTFLSPYTKQHMNVLRLEKIDDSHTKLVLEAHITPSTEIPQEVIEKFKTFTAGGQTAMYDSLATYLQSQQYTQPEKVLKEISV